MPSKAARVPGTRAVRQTDGGPVRVMHSAEAPVCSKCGTNENVVRLYHAGRKVWACRVHYKVTSTKRKEPTLLQRVLHKLPEADSFELQEVLVNRRHRRSMR